MYVKRAQNFTFRFFNLLAISVRTLSLTFFLQFRSVTKPKKFPLKPAQNLNITNQIFFKKNFIGIYNGRGTRQLEYLSIIRENYLNDFREDGQLKDGLKEELVNKLKTFVGPRWNIKTSKIWSRFVNNNDLWPIIAHEKQKANRK